MIDTSDDADLVARHLAGDRSGFATIYDRYADRLHDTAAAMTGSRHDAADIVQDVFVTAAERLGQLRDPSKLKPWLFAILRNEVYRRGRKRRRTVATDFSDPVADMAAPTDPDADGSRSEYEELASLVRAAAAGLDARDQLVLELSLRQDLEGDDLAAALGVSAQQGYGLVHRMRQRTERSLGAYCVARAGRRDCTVLAELLADWDGEFSVLVRKRVARHIDACTTCERSKAKLAPFPLFGAAPVLAAPADLRDRVLGAIGTPRPAPPYSFDEPGGFPSVLRGGRRIAAWITTASVVLLLGGAAWLLTERGDWLTIDDSPAATDSSDPTPSTRPEPGPPTTGGTDQPGAIVDDPNDDPNVASAGAAPPDSITIPATSTLPAPTTTGPVGPATTIATATATTTATTTAATTTPATTTPATTTPTTTSPAPGILALSAGSVDFGVSTNQVTLTLSNPGGLPVTWSVAQAGVAAVRSAPEPTARSPFAVSPTTGTLAAGGTSKVTITIDRSWPTEGPLPEGRITFSAPGTSAQVALRGTIARPPAVTLVARPPASMCVWNTQGFSWQVAISDESLPITARVEVVTPAGGTVIVPLARDVDWYGWTSGNHDGDPNGGVDVGIHSWTVVAKDRFGNWTEVSGSTTVVDGTQNC